MSPWHLKVWCLGNKYSGNLCGTPENQNQGHCEEMEGRRLEGLEAGSLVELNPLALPHVTDLVFIHMKTTGNLIIISKKPPNILRFSLIYKEIVKKNQNYLCKWQWP